MSHAFWKSKQAVYFKRLNIVDLNPDLNQYYFLIYLGSNLIVALLETFEYVYCFTQILTTNYLPLLCICRYL